MARSGKTNRRVSAKAGLVDKKATNNRYKYRGSAAVETLRKQVEFEKLRLKRNSNSALQANCLETESFKGQADNGEILAAEENVFQDLIDDLKTTAKKMPTFKEKRKPVTLLSSKSKKQCTEQNVKTNNETITRVPPISNQFKEHLQFELSMEEVDKLTDASDEIDKQFIEWPSLGKIYLENSSAMIKHLPSKLINKEPPIIITSSENLEQAGIQPALARKLQTSSLPFTELQSELFALTNIYKDLYYPYRNLINGEEIRLVYTLHAFNHILKTRAAVMLHNRKIEEATKSKKKKKNLNKIDILDDEFRDQGLVRPKVLIIVPFRDSAYRIISMMSEMIKDNGDPKCKTKVIEKQNSPASDNDENEEEKDENKEEKNSSDLEEISTNADQKTIMNLARFEKEFTGDTLYFPKTNPKPEDYECTFAGNTDDNFRIGLSLTKKTLKLYTDFYSSDILIASPLGLRLTMGGTSSADVECDFLNSIELLIIDQADVITAQNWDNLLHILDHMHLQPRKLRTTDINRVRSWCLNGLSKYYRQTLLFATHELPEFRGLFHHKCHNYAGRIKISNAIVKGSIRHVIVPLAHVYHRIETGNDLEEALDLRFEYFIKKILPQFRNIIYAHTMIYVPNYFDYVRIRNYLKEENMNFVQICEYTKREKMARARDMFFHSAAHFLLYSERSHYFKRTRLKGIRHIIMYQPPRFPNFYSEIVNFMHSTNQNPRDGLEDSMSITVLYNKYDTLQLNGILGSENTAQLLNSDKAVHVYSAI